MADPIIRTLSDLGKIRADIKAELLKLPAPGPLKQALTDIAVILDMTDHDISGISRNLSQQLADLINSYRRASGR